MPAKLLSCIFLVLTFYSDSFCSDTLKVSLKLKETFFKKPSTMSTPYLYCLGINDSDELYKEVKFPEAFPDLKLALLHFHYSQYLYYKYMSGKFSRKDYDEALKDNRAWPDTQDVVNRFVREYVIIGFQNRHGKILAFVDFNNNNDLSDETPIPFYQFPDPKVKPQKNKKPPVYRFTYEYYDGRKLASRTISASLFFAADHLFYYPGSGGLWIDSPKHFVLDGEAVIKGKDYKFSVRGDIVVRPRRYARLAVKEKSKKIVPGNYEYMPGDTVEVNGEYYKFEGLAFGFDTLYLRKLPGDLRPMGPYPGLYTPELKAETLDGKPFSLKDLKGKYVVLHLHDTFCKPAREQDYKTLPKVYEKYKNENVVFVSVAREDSLEKVKSYWKGLNAEWLKVYKFPSPYGKITKHAEQFNSYKAAFGRYYIIDPSGKVISKVLYYGPESLMEACDKVFGKSITIKQILR